MPTGEGLFAVSTIDDVLAAVEAVNGDYARHSRAAVEIARSYFAHDVVLPALLAAYRAGGAAVRGAETHPMQRDLPRSRFSAQKPP